jgi:fucose permease
VFGFQQSTIWGWGNPGIGLSIGVGLVTLVGFAVVESRTASPLIQVRIFRIRAFLVQNLVLGIAMLVFIPVFFFGSEYAQIALGKSSKQAGIILLFFFIGFVITAQIGGRILDRRGAKPPVVLGCTLAAVGFYLWADKVTQLNFSSQQWPIILSGAGIGFMLGPASTDAVNRASKLSYGEATGITQTVRNYAASLGLAILGTILVSQFHSQLTRSFISRGVPAAQASTEASSISQSQGSTSGSIASIPHYIRLDFADATRTVFYVMAGIMAVAAIVAVVGLERGLQSEPTEADAEPVSDDLSATADDPVT